VYVVKMTSQFHVEYFDVFVDAKFKICLRIKPKLNQKPSFPSATRLSPTTFPTFLSFIRTCWLPDCHSTAVARR
jgi:hypothetical protein